MKTCFGFTEIKVGEKNAEESKQRRLKVSIQEAAETRRYVETVVNENRTVEKEIVAKRSLERREER